MNDAIIEFRDVWKTYGKEKTEINALKGINFSLKKNSVNLILGPSGSGKTTLLNIASLMDTPTKGMVKIKGRSTPGLSKAQRSRIRMNEIGIIYQRSNLFPYLNILENTMLPMISPDKNRALELLKNMEITEINKFPQELSIEEQQRAALARAMINDPSLILADEPTGELDSGDTDIILELIKDIGHRTIILIVSNNSDLVKYADNLFFIKNGKLEKN